ncbi:hypothetical protein EN35_02715 [Rhodococcus qingshengii]|nr:hypothetical protein EN35_02715 [Rhodococcus qingshengii]
MPASWALRQVDEQLPVRRDRTRQGHEIAVTSLKVLERLAAAQRFGSKRRVGDHLLHLSRNGAILLVRQYVQADFSDTVRRQIRCRLAFGFGAQIVDRDDAQIGEGLCAVRTERCQIGGTKHAPGADGATEARFGATDVSEVRQGRYDGRQLRSIGHT